MQIFFHVALMVMHLVDEGKLSLAQQPFIKKQDLLPDTYSPSAISIPKVTSIDRFINSPCFVIKNDEAGLHENWCAQFLNTTTPDFATDLLRLFL